MNADEVVRRRLAALGLSAVSAPPAGTTVRRAVQDVVRRLGAVQSQDYAPACWSIAQRLPPGTVTQADVDALYDDGSLLRTHALRTTWHFLAPDDLALVQQVTAPRVLAGDGPRLRQLGLTTEVVARSHAALAEALAGGVRLSRRGLAERLAAQGLPTDTQRLAHLVMHAELSGLVVSGGLEGKQHTYVLAEGRVPPPQPWDDDAALAELTRRFFTSHGPATAKDFRWWSSLTLAQVARGLELVGDGLERAVLEESGEACWLAPGAAGDVPVPRVLMLQGFDEYTVAFPHTRAVLDPDGILPTLPGGRPVYNLVLLVDGRLGGHWKRTVRGTVVDVEVQLYRALDRTARAALEAAVAEHGRYLGAEARLTTRLR